MRQISGTIGGDAPPRLNADPCIELAQADGVRVAVLAHTRARHSARALLHAYQQHGPDAVQKLAGDNAVIVLDEPTCTVVLTRDVLGVTPLYYGTAGSVFAFATRIADVLAAPGLERQPDRAALAGLLIDHHGAPDGRTYFQDVYAVPPRGTLVWRAHRLELLTPFQGNVVEIRPISYQHAVEQFREHLQRAVVNRLDVQRPTAVLVSGGLDSAALISIAARHGAVFGITYGPQDDPAADESRYVDGLRAQGLSIERVPFYPTMDVASFEQSILATEAPAGDVVALTLQRAKHAARARGARVLLLGTWGDQVLAPFPPPHLAALPPWRVTAAAAPYQRYLADVSRSDIRSALIRQSLRSRAPAWLLRAQRKRRRHASMFDVLAAEFAPAAVRAVPARYGEAVALNVSATAQVEAMASSFKWAQYDGLDARLPFLDAELVQFLTAVPDDVAYHQHRLKPLLRDAMKGMVPDMVLERRDKGDYTAVMQRDLLPVPLVLELLDELRRPIEFGLMSRRSAAKTLAQLGRAANIADRQDEIMQLLSVDTWLRLYFQNTL